jgi:hypothetical protein
LRFFSGLKWADDRMPRRGDLSGSSVHPFRIP